MVRRLLVVLLPLLLLGAVLSPVAGATLVRVVVAEEIGDDGGYDREDVYSEVSTIRVAAHRGERNRVSVRVLSAGVVVVTDTGSRGGLHAGAGCRRTSRTRVVCRPDVDLGGVDVALRDGDDRLVARGTTSVLPLIADLGPGRDRAQADGAARLHGGPGNDVLRTGRGGDALSGDAGDDRLEGGDGDDVLSGGTGRDRLTGGRGDDELRARDGARGETADLVDGGPGRDIASYVGRRIGVRVTLGGLGRSGLAYTPEDRLAGVEGAYGGTGDDVLLGGRGDDVLWGGEGGRDRLEGRGGDDAITLGIGEDRASGGVGDDRISSVGYPGTVDCGAGADLVAAGAATLVGASCERVGTSLLAPGAMSVPLPVAATADTLTFDVTCPLTRCGSWRFVLLTPGTGASWAGPDAARTGIVLAGAVLPVASGGERRTVTVPRPAGFARGRPVVAALEQVSGSYTYAVVSWGLRLP